ncbi:hypothetical protein Tco_0706849 [Tanacetum coccineum]|uniref:Uncharacterized protein n=1 Tax=Tanacetum coccineum TaxID=301880 RepID=A0ABQ4Y8K7_9ASTR
MKFLLTLVACWGTDEHASLTSYVSNMDEAKNLVVGVVREKKLTRSGYSGPTNSPTDVTRTGTLYPFHSPRVTLKLYLGWTANGRHNDLDHRQK